MEVLAQKKRGAPWSYIMFIIMGVICIVASTVVLVKFIPILETFITALLPMGIIFALGVYYIVTGIRILVRVRNTPDSITLSGSQVDLGNGLIVNLKDIVRVDYKQDRAKHSVYSWGTLTVQLEDQKITYYYYDDVQYARDRMMLLISQAKD